MKYVVKVFSALCHLGVGAKPMLDELPGLMRDMADRIKELEAYGKGMEEVYAELGARTQVLSDRLVKAVAERDELARDALSLAAEVLRGGTTHMCGGKDYCNGCGKNVTHKPIHAPGCPVALAERVLKESGDVLR